MPFPPARLFQRLRHVKLHRTTAFAVLDFSRSCSASSTTSVGADLLRGGAAMSAQIIIYIAAFAVSALLAYRLSSPFERRVELPIR